MTGMLDSETNRKQSIYLVFRLTQFVLQKEAFGTELCI